jgi:uncharacterized protein (DUF983 family)
MGGECSHDGGHTGGVARGAKAGRPRFLRVLARGLLRRCPRCGARGLFDGWFDLKPACPSCGLETERGEGFWLGGMAVNLGITEAIFGGFLVASIAATWPDPPWTLILVVGLAINAIVPVVLYPVAKSVFLGIDMLMFRMDPMRDQPAGPYESVGGR